MQEHGVAFSPNSRFKGSLTTRQGLDHVVTAEYRAYTPLAG